MRLPSSVNKALNGFKNNCTLMFSCNLTQRKKIWVKLEYCRQHISCLPFRWQNNDSDVKLIGTIRR